MFKVFSLGRVVLYTVFMVCHLPKVLVKILVKALVKALASAVFLILEEILPLSLPDLSKTSKITKTSEKTNI